MQLYLTLSFPNCHRPSFHRNSKVCQNKGCVHAADLKGNYMQLYLPPLLYQLSSQSAFIPIFFGYFISTQNPQTFTQFHFTDIVKTGEIVTKPLKKADRPLWLDCVGLEAVTRDFKYFEMYRYQKRWHAGRYLC